MISPEYIGLAGSVILVIAWLFETIEGIKEHKALIDLRFAVASLVAVLLLVVYSWMIENLIFYWLNIILGIIVVLEIVYTLGVKKVKFK